MSCEYTVRSSAVPEGVLDVSFLIHSYFDNPLKEHSISFLSEVLTQGKRAVLPVSAVLCAYHIATRYLRVPRLTVKKNLEGILRSGSPALYPQIIAQTALDALDYASTYNIESWDGYFVSLARSLGSTVVFSLDAELAKIREVIVVNPLPLDEVERYHEFMKNKMC